MPTHLILAQAAILLRALSFAGVLLLAFIAARRPK
jgi:hypothetical protein